MFNTDERDERYPDLWEKIKTEWDATEDKSKDSWDNVVDRVTDGFRNTSDWTDDKIHEAKGYLKGKFS